MRQIAAISVAFVLALACAKPAATKGDAADREQLEQAYRLQDEAIRRNDAEAFLATLAQSYAVTLRSGQNLVRPEIDAAIRADMLRTRRVHAVRSVLESLRIEDDRAFVIVLHETSRVLDDARSVPHHWENAVRHREIWERTALGWRIVSLEELDQVYLRRDGQDVK